MQNHSFLDFIHFVFVRKTADRQRERQRERANNCCAYEKLVVARASCAQLLPASFIFTKLLLLHVTVVNIVDVVDDDDDDVLHRQHCGASHSKNLFILSFQRQRIRYEIVRVPVGMYKMHRHTHTDTQFHSKSISMRRQAAVYQQQTTSSISMFVRSFVCIVLISYEIVCCLSDVISLLLSLPALPWP